MAGYIGVSEIIMNKALIILLSTLSSIAYGNNTDIGTDCKTAWEIEKSKGSFISSEKIPGSIVYENIFYDKNAFIIYECYENKVSRKVVMIKPEPIEISKYTYESIKKSLSNKYGKPDEQNKDMINMMLNKGINIELSKLLIGATWSQPSNKTINLHLQPEDNNTFYVAISGI